ncbi:MAG: hypothetical protein LBP87_09530, partial [Planctomycetaceae bacterium]|nr:hypothetical protein [Planctomycetaceae bacterium]
SGTELLKLTGHTDWVKSVCFSPDGKEVLTGSDDNTARIWDAGASDQSIAKETQLRKKAENGNAEEQFKLGNLYYNGDGVSKNIEEALRWWKKAGLQGHQGSVDALQKHARATIAAEQRKQEEEQRKREEEERQQAAARASSSSSGSGSSGSYSGGESRPRQLKICPNCSGTTQQQCFSCDGKGITYKLFEGEKRCYRCGGNGRIECSTCGGRGNLGYE